MNREPIRSWLLGELPTLSGVVSAYLFGSMLDDQAACSDVDCVIVFDRWNVGEGVTETKKRFFSRFNKPLHVQLFHQTQVGLLKKFLRRAVVWKVLL